MPNHIEAFKKIANMDPDAAAFVGAMVQTNYDAYADTTQRLIESLQQTVAELTAERELMIEYVYRLLNGVWMPTPAAIKEAMIIHPRLIAERIRAKAED